MKYNLSFPKGRITCRDIKEGESIEQKMSRMINNKEPIPQVTDLIYTERKAGVLAETDIRTDRWELARKSMDYVNKSNIAKREKRFEDMEKAMREQLQNSGGEA